VKSVAAATTAKLHNAGRRNSNICVAFSIVPRRHPTAGYIFIAKREITVAAFMQRQVGCLPVELGIEMF